MTASRSAAEPLWKYGARAAKPRRIGPLNLPMSANLPEMSARPGSVTLFAGQLGPTTLVPSLEATHFRSEAAQDRAFELADVGELARDERATRIGDALCRTTRTHDFGAVA